MPPNLIAILLCTVFVGFPGRTVLAAPLDVLDDVFHDAVSEIVPEPTIPRPRRQRQGQGVRLEECKLCIDFSDQTRTSCGFAFEPESQGEFLVSQLPHPHQCPFCERSITILDDYEKQMSIYLQDWKSRTSFMHQKMIESWVLKPGELDQLYIPRPLRNATTYNDLRNASEHVWELYYETRTILDEHISALRQKRRSCGTKWNILGWKKVKTWVNINSNRLSYYMRTSTNLHEWGDALETAVQKQFVFATGRNMTKDEDRARERIRRRSAVNDETYLWYLNILRSIARLRSVEMQD